MMEFMELLHFMDLGSRKPQYETVKHRCSCNSPNPLKFWFLCKNQNSARNSCFPHSWWFLWKSGLLQKLCPKASRTPKKGWNTIGLTSIWAAWPRGCGKLDFLTNPQQLFQKSNGKYDFHVKSWKFMKFHHSAHLQTLAQTNGLTCALKKRGGGTVTHTPFGKKCGIPPLLAFRPPKVHFSAQNRSFGSPAQNPL